MTTRRGSGAPGGGAAGKADAVMDAASLKTCTGHFDLESAYKLSMCRMGIRRIQCLELCPNLTDLDLSHNRINRMEGFDGLDMLKRLSLADNEIARLENLEMLSSLETLLLQGNRISNLDDVQTITQLPSLKALQLQVRGGDADERNPICDHPAYRTAVRRMLPSLQSLDGERTALADAMPPTESDPFAEIALSEPKPWLAGYAWELETFCDAQGTGNQMAGAREFDQTLTDCKRLSARAQSLIDDTRARTPR